MTSSTHPAPQVRLLMKQTDGDLNRVKGHNKDVLWNSQTEQITQETVEKKVVENWEQTTIVFI